jgi:hypothetical protein
LLLQVLGWALLRLLMHLLAAPLFCSSSLLLSTSVLLLLPVCVAAGAG